MSAARTFSSTPFASPGVTPQSLGVPAAAYPGRIATNSDLIVAVDRQQTRLALPLNASDTSMTVADPSVIVAYSLLSIDNELVKTTGPASGNVVPVSRGFDGTTPAVHLAGATVSGMVDAFHHNGLVAEIEAIETALGANLANLPTSPFVINGPFNFAPQSPGGSLIVGANSISLTPVPPGVSGTDIGHYVLISGGTGTTEAALIIGGTAVGGAASGTLIIQCANTHSGAWTIRSATGGIQEAVCSLAAAGGTVLVNSPVTLSANVGPCGKTAVQIKKLAGTTIAGSFTVFGQSSAGDGRAETFASGPGTIGDTVLGTSPTWLSARTPAWGLAGANVNNYPFIGLNPTQFGANAVVGAINVPAAATVDGGQALLGLAATSSPTACAVGVAAYASTLTAGCRAWGGNFAVSNQVNPASPTVGVHAASIIGLELDVNIFSGGADGVVGLQVVGSASTVTPTVSSAIEVAPLGDGSVGGVKWGAGIKFVTGSTVFALDVFPASPANNSGSQKFQFWSVDSGGTARQSQIGTAPDGTLVLVGGNGSPASGVLLQDGAGNTLMGLAPGAAALAPLPVFADNAGAAAGGLGVGRLYRTATGQVMQRF